MSKAKRRGKKTPVDPVASFGENLALELEVEADTLSAHGKEAASDGDYPEAMDCESRAAALTWMIERINELLAERNA